MIAATKHAPESSARSFGFNKPKLKRLLLAFLCLTLHLVAAQVMRVSDGWPGVCDWVSLDLATAVKVVGATASGDLPLGFGTHKIVMSLPEPCAHESADLTKAHAFTPINESGAPASFEWQEDLKTGQRDLIWTLAEPTDSRPTVYRVGLALTVGDVTKNYHWVEITYFPCGSAEVPVPASTIPSLQFKVGSNMPQTKFVDLSEHFGDSLSAEFGIDGGRQDCSPYRQLSASYLDGDRPPVEITFSGPHLEVTLAPDVNTEFESFYELNVWMTFNGKRYVRATSRVQLRGSEEPLLNRESERLLQPTSCATSTFVNVPSTIFTYKFAIGDTQPKVFNLDSYFKDRFSQLAGNMDGYTECSAYRVYSYANQGGYVDVPTQSLTGNVLSTQSTHPEEFDSAWTLTVKIVIGGVVYAQANSFYYFLGKPVSALCQNTVFDQPPAQVFSKQHIIGVDTGTFTYNLDTYFQDSISMSTFNMDGYTACKAYRVYTYTNTAGLAGVPSQTLAGSVLSTQCTYPSAFTSTWSLKVTIKISGLSYGTATSSYVFTGVMPLSPCETTVFDQPPAQVFSKQHIIGVDTGTFTYNLDTYFQDSYSKASRNMDGYTACKAYRVYTYTNTAGLAGVPTQTLAGSVLSTQCTYQSAFTSTWSLTVTIQIGGVLYGTATSSYVFTGVMPLPPCATSVFDQPPAQVFSKQHIIGVDTGTFTYNLDTYFQDSYSKASGNMDGYTACKAYRVYTYANTAGLAGVPSQTLAGSVLSTQCTYQSAFTSTWSLTVTIQIGGVSYGTATSSYVFTGVMPLPPCATSEFQASPTVIFTQNPLLLVGQNQQITVNLDPLFKDSYSLSAGLADGYSECASLRSYTVQFVTTHPNSVQEAFASVRISGSQLIAVQNPNYTTSAFSNRYNVVVSLTYYGSVRASASSFVDLGGDTLKETSAPVTKKFESGQKPKFQLEGVTLQHELFMGAAWKWKLPPGKDVFGNPAKYASVDKGWANSFLQHDEAQEMLSIAPNATTSAKEGFYRVKLRLVDNDSVFSDPLFVIISLKPNQLKKSQTATQFCRILLARQSLNTGRRARHSTSNLRVKAQSMESATCMLNCSDSAWKGKKRSQRAQARSLRGPSARFNRLTRLGSQGSSSQS